MKTNSILRIFKLCVEKFNTRFLDPAQKTAKKQANFLCGILKTQKFEKMAIPEKITTVARLLSMFEKDYGYAPILLTQMLLELNAQLNSSVVQLFSQFYS